MSVEEPFDTDNVPAIIAPGRVQTTGKSICLSVVLLSNNVHAAETAEENVERLSGRRGLQRQRERDRIATRQRHREGEGWLSDCNPWARRTMF